MDKKSFVKGLFTGLGVSLACLIVAGGVIACNQKPVTTTPVVNKAEEERGVYVSRPSKAFTFFNWGICGTGSNWYASYGNEYDNSIRLISSNSGSEVAYRKLVYLGVGDVFYFMSNTGTLKGWASFNQGSLNNFALSGTDSISTLVAGFYDFSMTNAGIIDVSLSNGFKKYSWNRSGAGSPNGSFEGTIVSSSRNYSLSYIFCTGSALMGSVSGNSQSIPPYVEFTSSSSRYFYFQNGDLYNVRTGSFEYLVTYSLPTQYSSYFTEVIEYQLIGSSNYCSYSYTNNNDGTGYVDVTPDVGYSVNVNEWTDGTATLSGASFQRSMVLGDGVYRLYFTNISQDGWSATFNAVFDSDNYIVPVFNGTHCTCTNLPSVIRKGSSYTFEVDVDGEDTYDYYIQYPEQFSVSGGDLDFFDDSSADAGAYSFEVSDIQAGFALNVNAYPSADLTVNTTNCTYSLVNGSIGGNHLNDIVVLNVKPNDGYGLYNGSNYLESFTPVECRVSDVSARLPDGSVNVTLTGFGASSCSLSCVGTPLVAVTIDTDNASVIHGGVGLPNSDVTIQLVPDEGYTFEGCLPQYNGLAIQSSLVNGGGEYVAIATVLGGSPSLSIYPKKAILRSVTFPSNWSPLAMFGGQIDSSGNILDNSELQNGYEQVITLWGFTFWNQGRYYNRLRIGLIYLAPSVTGYKDADGNVHQGNGQQWILGYVQYAYNESSALNNNVDDVYRYTAGYATYSDLGGNPVYDLGLHWVNEEARTIGIVKPDLGRTGTRYTFDNVPIGEDMSDLDFLLAYSNSVSTGLYLGGSSLYSDPFTLLASALGVATGFMSYMVLPNVTIGMIVIIPLIVALIVMLLRLIKK